jgi:protein tyrosine phosphatase (PTP) superfamily phosphohydrolase (DUF442 family)
VPGRAFPDRLNRRHWLAWAAATPLAARAAGIEAPNVVVISPRLVTSGQPTAASLERLGALGFGAVVHLAPLTVADAVRDEDRIVQRQGLDWVHIPIAFDAPADADFEACSAAISRLSERRLLVHCQLNFRASSMVFLHRVITLREPAEAAYDAVARVWSPVGAWKALIVRQLRRHAVAFVPY